MCTSSTNNEIGSIVRQLSSSTRTDVDSIERFLLLGYREGLHSCDLYGFHPLFYWQRTRGLGYWLHSDDVEIVFSFRQDVGRFQFVRLAGDPVEVASICEDIAWAVSRRWNWPIVARYCTDDIAKQLLTGSFVVDDAFSWSETCALDDETYSQVLILTEGVVSLAGEGNRKIRQSIKRHEDETEYLTLKRIDLASCEEFVLEELPLSAKNNHLGQRELRDYLKSTFDAIRLLDDSRERGLTFHKLRDSAGRIRAFGVSASARNEADLHLFSHAKDKRLGTYFLYKIVQYYNELGVRTLNLGGSETSSLHWFKLHFSSSHESKESRLLRYASE